MGEQHEPSGAIVVISKCPIAGKSKTRLIPLLGENGSVALAKAMLSDVLLTLDRCSELEGVQKILFYAPGDEDGLQLMTHIFDELQISYSRTQEEEQSSSPKTVGSSNTSWSLMPMKSKVDLQSSDLGDLLEHALERARKSIQNRGSVVFLGMDSPVLPLGDIVGGLSQPFRDQVVLCPADDGGYGMLSVPSSVDATRVFRGVQWSHALTAVSQLKALTDHSIPIRIGRLMYDIDEPDDVKSLCLRLSQTSSTTDPLSEPSTLLETCTRGASSEIVSSHTTCFHTRKALWDGGLLQSDVL